MEFTALDINRHLFLSKFKPEDDTIPAIVMLYKENILTLRDKKRCCLVVTGFEPEKIDELHKIIDTTKETVFKGQWFHSALALYTLLTKPELRPEESFVNCIITAKTEQIFINIAKDVLLNDQYGVNFIKMIDNKDPLVFMDEYNKHKRAIISENSNNSSAGSNINSLQE